MSRKWEHDGLAADLANKLLADDANMVWTDMQLGPAGSPRPDVYLLKKSYKRFQPLTYEVKVSVADFRRDVTAGKWQDYLAFSAGVIFAMPAGLVPKEEIPTGAGLIVRSDTGWRNLKKPTLSAVDTLPHRVWMKMLIDGVDATRTRKSAEFRESASSWRTDRKLREKFGSETAQLVSAARHSKDRLNAAIEAREKQADEIRRGTNKELEHYRELMRRNADRLDGDLAHLAVALGADPNIGAAQLAMLIREVRSRIDENAEIQRLRRQLSIIQSAVAEGTKRFPGEEANDNGLASSQDKTTKRG